MAELEQKAATMRDLIVQRVRSVGDQLAGREPPPLKFDEQGIASLADWREEPDIGKPRIDQPMKDGRTTLRILGGDGECRASWRLWIYLQPGRYQFQGQVRTSGVSNGGAGLRISGDTRNRRIAGDTAWVPLRHDFVVEEGSGDVELVCELRTYQPGGEVWFDAGSLRLKRLF